jgi:hypothetical protein
MTMTNDKIIELLNSEDGKLIEAFDGLGQYDAMRLGSKIISVLKQDDFNLNETIVSNMHRFFESDKTDRIARYWVVKNVAYLGKSTGLANPYGKNSNRAEAILGTKAILDLLRMYLTSDFIPENPSLDECLKIVALRSFRCWENDGLQGDENDVDAFEKYKEEYLKIHKQEITEKYNEWKTLGALDKISTKPVYA